MSRLKRSAARVGSLALLASASFFVAGCQTGDEAEEVAEVVAQPRESALISGNSGGGPGGVSGTIDSLPTYAAKCDAATGVHVPGFDCTLGTEVPQGSSTDNIEHDNWVGGGTGGGRTPPVYPSVVESIKAAGTGFGSSSDQFYYSYVDEVGAAVAEVKVTSLSGPSTSRAGMMLRQTGTANNDVNAFVYVTPSGGISFIHRDTAGMGYSAPVAASSTFPIWLRLTFTSSGTVAQWSPNHSTWNQLGALAPMVNLQVASVVVGLAVASGSASTQATAGFDKFMTTKFCDKPNVLSGTCDPSSKFQVLARTADAIVVANCRKGGQTANNMFGDIAVIQYNRKNGAVCFYQSDTLTPQNGVGVSAPILGGVAPRFPWKTPDETHQGGCTSCHDNGALIRSPYLWQTGLLPYSKWDLPGGVDEGYENNGKNPLRYVGADFANDHSWAIDAPQDSTDKVNNLNCNYCHQLAVNDVTAPINPGHSGTAFRFAEMATSQDQTDGDCCFFPTHKNPVGVGSPMWMRPGGYTTYDPYAFNTAKNFDKCAKDFIYASVPYTDSPESMADGCSYTPYGMAYAPPFSALSDLNIPAGSWGSSSGTLAFATINASANTDVYTASDKFFWSYVNKNEDGSAIVKVNSLTAVGGTLDQYAKAGIMIRDGVGAGAVNVLLALTGSAGATFQYRPTTGANTPTPAFLAGKTAPIWLKLSRSGNTYVGAVSSDSGATWQQVGQPVTLPAMTTVNVGLVATAHNPSTGGAKAMFESFDWTKAQGWTAATDPHILADASIGANSTGGRTEYKTADTLTAKGGDINSNNGVNADIFQYAFKTFSGDGVAITKVTSQTAAPGAIDPYAKAGLMFRETGADSSANVFLGKTPSGATIQQRTTTGGATTPTNVTAVGLPRWFKLLRTRNTFIGSTSTDGVNWTQVGDPAVFTTFSATPLVGVAASSHSTANTLTAVFDSDSIPEPPGFQWTSGLGGLTWLDASMGLATGSHTTSGATETIVGSGADIYNYADAFYYSWKNITGNATITARVTSLTPYPSGTINGYAKAGVMFRDSATPGSPNAFMTLTAAQGASFQARTVAGANTPVPPFVTGPIGYWVRVQRSGVNSDTYTGSVSSNGTSWTTVGTVTMNTIGANALVGLAVTSHDATKSVQATFTNVAFGP